MNGRVGSVVVLLVGYLLGRTRKLKLVLRMASAIGGRRLLNNRRNVMGRLAKVLDSSPEGKRFVNNVTGLRTPHEAVRKASETIGRAPRPAGEDRAVERERRPRPESAAGSRGERSGRSSGGEKGSQRPSRTHPAVPRPGGSERGVPEPRPARSGHRGKKPMSR